MHKCKQLAWLITTKQVVLDTKTYDMKSRIATLTLTIFFCATVWAQTKNEYEERLELQNFPETAIAVINTLPTRIKRIKFYKEQDGTKSSFEAKFKYKKQKYSIEFDSMGTIEDVEVTLNTKKIEGKTATNIKAYFKENYTKSKLIKVQQQYVYNPTLSAESFVKNILNKTSTAKINYEIIAEVTANSKRAVKEFTFDGNGLFLNLRIVIPSSYDHVLY